MTAGGLRSPVLALTLAPLLWSGNFVAGRALGGLVDPLTLNFLRWLIALLLVAPFVWREAVASLPALRREWRFVLVLGATGIGAFQILVYLALQSTTATSALLMLSFAPVAILLGSAIVGGDRPTHRQVAGALISIGGAAVLITRGDFPGIVARGFNVGDLAMALAVVIWAVYALTMRRRPADLPSTVATAASMAGALLLMAPFLVFASTPAAAFASRQVLLSIGYIALFSSAIAFLLWSYGVAQLGPARAGQFVHLIPIFGATLAFAILDEVPSGAQLIGAALVLLGIAVVELRPRETQLAMAPQEPAPNPSPTTVR